jgi:hypothetical protein
MVLPVITLIGWDAMPDRSRALCLTLTDRAVAAIDGIESTAGSPRCGIAATSKE